MIDDIRRGKLVPVLPESTMDEIDVYILTANKTLAQKVNLAIEHCRRYFQDAASVTLG